MIYVVFLPSITPVVQHTEVDLIRQQLFKIARGWHAFVLQDNDYGSLEMARKRKKSFFHCAMLVGEVSAEAKKKVGGGVGGLSLFFCMPSTHRFNVTCSIQVAVQDSLCLIRTDEIACSLKPRLCCSKRWSDPGQCSLCLHPESKSQAACVAVLLKLDSLREPGPWPLPSVPLAVSCTLSG